MKTTLQSLCKIQAVFACVIYVTLLFSSVTVLGQTTIFSDDFNRGAAGPLSSGGMPSVTYTNTLTGIATIQTVLTTVPDYRVQIINGISAGTAGKTFSMAPMPVTASYQTTLKNNTGVVTWTFNMRHNRSSGTTMSGFDAGQWGVATIIACDNANPTDATARGYAVVMGGVGTKSSFDLVSFTGGITATANLTTIIAGVPLTTFKNVASIKVTYDAGTNKWNMFQKDEGSAVATTAYPDPSSLSVVGIGEVLDTAGFVDVALPNFGFLFSHGTTLNNSYFIDNYKVTVGSAVSSTYYLAANSDATILSNWGANTNGTGTQPKDFTAANQTFNIFNTGATIGSDWTVNGSASKVVLGDGTNANSLMIPATAFLDGKIDLAASTTLTIGHTTKFPAINTISSTSSVIFNGAADQIIQTGSYGNLTVNTTGTLNSPGALSVAGALIIANGSILNMGANKLLAVGSVSGTGTLKTQYSSSASATALPADLTWPFSIAYNSLTSTQSIVQGNYTNLDITGGGPRNLLGAILSVSGTLLADGVTFNSGTSLIDFKGTTAQTLGNDFPASAMKISNSSASGLSLTASDRILDATNLELAGNLSSGGFNEVMGTLTLTNISVLNLSSAPHNIAFANSSLAGWDTSKTVTIKGWTGTAGASGTNGRVFFGSDATGLTLEQLGQITFDGYAGATILASGEVVPTSSLGIQKQDRIAFKYYPNPVIDSITLFSNMPIASVAVYSILGQKVLTAQPNAISTKIDMSCLSPSTYLIEVTTEGNTETFKVVKK
jgi:hypothetical protein